MKREQPFFWLESPLLKSSTSDPCNYTLGRRDLALDVEDDEEETIEQLCEPSARSVITLHILMSFFCSLSLLSNSLKVTDFLFDLVSNGFRLQCYVLKLGQWAVDDKY